MKRTAEDRRWSKAIRERAGFKCQRCWVQHEPTSQGLHAAHIFSRGIKRVRLDMDNGLSLCYGCHAYCDHNPLEKETLARGILGDQDYEALRLRAHVPSKRARAS